MAPGHQHHPTSLIVRLILKSYKSLVNTFFFSCAIIDGTYLEIIIVVASFGIFIVHRSHDCFILKVLKTNVIDFPDKSW